MGTKAQELITKLARVYIPPHVRMRDGDRQDVDGYWREVKGGNAIANALQEQKTKATGKPAAKPSKKAPNVSVPKAKKVNPNTAKPAKVPTTAKKQATLQESATPDTDKLIEKLKVGKPEKSKQDQKLDRIKRVIDEKPDPQDGESPENPIITEDVDEAIKALAADKYVRLRDKHQVSTLVDKLAELVEDAKAKGEDAPKIDLCKVSVPDTNLFCSEALSDSDVDEYLGENAGLIQRDGRGIPRVAMPQIGGIPEPGSQADKFEKNKGGEVDLSGEFIKYLQSKDLPVSDETVPASHLKASQNQLGGPQVAVIAKSMDEKGIDPERAWLWVSSDGYIIDGHHRWAAMVTVGAKKDDLGWGPGGNIPIHRVDLDIVSALKLVRAWTDEMGIKKAELGAKPVELAAQALRSVLGLKDCGC